MSRQKVHYFNLYLSNSLVFKHEDGYGIWFHDALIPGVHFIQLKNDCSDLVEKLAYYMSNEEEAKEIAQNAREFTFTHLIPEHVAIYCYKALVKYTSLQRFKPRRP